jgi:hypothetical protein
MHRPRSPTVQPASDTAKRGANFWCVSRTNTKTAPRAWHANQSFRFPAYGANISAQVRRCRALQNAGDDHMSKLFRYADQSRRRFLMLSAAGIAAAPIARIAMAQGADKLDENSSQAKALDYHADASKVTNPKRKSDQFCNNCQFYQGKAADASAPCTVFQGKLVAAKGWCSTWVAKT